MADEKCDDCERPLKLTDEEANAILREHCDLLEKQLPGDFGVVMLLVSDDGSQSFVAANIEPVDVATVINDWAVEAQKDFDKAEAKAAGPN